MFVATLIAADALEKGILNSAMEALTSAGCEPASPSWIDKEIACDIFFTKNRDAADEALSALSSKIDFAVQEVENRQKSLLISDMDSTMITVECIDELADYAGIKSQIAHITERAMRGELDFEEALRGRVQLLAGLDAKMIETCLQERVTLMKGAQTLVQTMKAWGAKTILVSGGFTDFADVVARQIGFDEAVANRLEIIEGELSGKLAGPIVDSATKKNLLIEKIAQYGLSRAATMAVGDGANDIPMIEAAGLGAAYHAKPKAVAAADMSIRHSDLTALLYAQGIARSDWVKPG